MHHRRTLTADPLPVTFGGVALSLATAFHILPSLGALARLRPFTLAFARMHN